MKNHLLILATCCLAVVVSCNKNGPDNPNDEKLAQERDAIATVLATLAGQDFDNTKDIPFEGKTFEPVYGVARDEANPNERSVKVRSAIYSENSFCSLAGGGAGLIKGTSDGMVLDLSGSKFGKLTFHRAPGGANVGYVDVDIPCIPHLEKISYKTKDQLGENAGEESIYGFGDVFKDDKGRHYIVVSEVDGSMPGWMVHMAPGRGDDFSYYGSLAAPWGPWLPNKHYDVTEFGIPARYAEEMDYRVIQDYITLCVDESFTSRKKKIVEATGRKVFPALSLWKSGSVFETENYEGFSTTRPGYNHYIGGDTETVGAKIIYSCSQQYGDVKVKYIYFPCNCNKPEYKMQWMGGYAGKGDSFTYPIDDQEEFEKYFYAEPSEGIVTPGSVAVYTAYCVPFTNENTPGFEKVEID